MIIPPLTSLIGDRRPKLHDRWGRRRQITPVSKAAPPKVVTPRDLEFRRRSTRSQRAKRDRAHSDVAHG